MRGKNSKQKNIVPYNNTVNGMGINYLLAERKESDRKRINAAMNMNIRPAGVGQI